MSTGTQPAGPTFGLPGPWGAMMNTTAVIVMAGLLVYVVTVQHPRDLDKTRDLFIAALQKSREVDENNMKGLTAAVNNLTNALRSQGLDVQAKELESVEPMTAAADVAGGIAQADKAGKVCVARFTAAWCGPCRALERHTLADKRVRDWLAANAVTVTIDGDRDPGAMTRYHVRSYPTVIVFRGGKERARVVGYRSPAAFLAELRKGGAK